MQANRAVATTIADYLTLLGGIPADRVRMSPTPGSASFADCVTANEGEPRGLCELVDGVLVEKAMSFEASVVAGTILFLLKRFIQEQGVGVGLVSGADGFFPSSVLGAWAGRSVRQLRAIA